MWKKPRNFLGNLSRFLGNLSRSLEICRVPWKSVAFLGNLSRSYKPSHFPCACELFWTWLETRSVCSFGSTSYWISNDFELPERACREATLLCCTLWKSAKVFVTIDSRRRSVVVRGCKHNLVTVYHQCSGRIAALNASAGTVSFHFMVVHSCVF